MAIGKELGPYIVWNIKNLYRSVPDMLIIALLLIAILGSIIIFAVKRIKPKRSYVGGMLLIEYFLLLFFATVFLRPLHEVHEYNFHFFWSYFAFYKGALNIMAINIMNIVVFVPLGVLLSISYRGITLYRVFVLSALSSILIEVLQFVLKRGVAEIDDVFHNTLGFGLYRFFSWIWIKIVRLRTC